ncbi:hypothetical protein VTN96DRAFT_4607 [Rasamsonia emersonii]
MPSEPEATDINPASTLPLRCCWYGVCLCSMPTAQPGTPIPARMYMENSTQVPDVGAVDTRCHESYPAAVVFGRR